MAHQCSATLLIAVAVAGLFQHVQAGRFGDRLFAASLPHANRSLHGEFISEMVAGTLPLEAFREFLFQDNLYLSKYARAFAVLAARATRTDELAWLANQSVNYLHEHGPGANDALDDSVYDREAAPVTVAYASYFLDTVWGKNQVLGYASVLPCQRLYDWLFSTIKATCHIADDNPYKPLIDHYADPANHRTTKVLENYLERYVGDLSDIEANKAQHIYNMATKFEADFFAQALTLSRSRAHPSMATRAKPSKQDIVLLLASSRNAHRRQTAKEDGRTNAWSRVVSSVPIMLVAAMFGHIGMCFYSRWFGTAAQSEGSSGKLPLLSA